MVSLNLLQWALSLHIFENEHKILQLYSGSPICLNTSMITDRIG